MAKRKSITAKPADDIVKCAGRFIAYKIIKGRKECLGTFPTAAAAKKAQGAV